MRTWDYYSSYFEMCTIMLQKNKESNEMFVLNVSQRRLSECLFFFDATGVFAMDPSMDQAMRCVTPKPWQNVAKTTSQ